MEAEKNDGNKRIRVKIANKRTKAAPGSFKEVIAHIEGWALQGWRKWIAVPILIVFLIIPLILGFIDGISKLSNFLKNTFGEKKVYATVGEKTAFNEWVAIIDRVNNEDMANKLCKEFKETYDSSRHRISENDIFCVKSDSIPGEWLIIIDAGKGRSTPEEVNRYMEDMRIYANNGRALQNTLLRRIKDAYSHYYDSLSYIKHYGTIMNPGRP